MVEKRMWEIANSLRRVRYDFVYSRKLVKEVESRGLNIVDLIIYALYGELDPKIIIESRIELAEKYLGEAKNYLDKGSAIQVSEKM